MLTRHSRKFLRFIEKSAPGFWNSVVTFPFIFENYPEDDNSVYEVIRYLVDLEYLRISYLGKEPKGVALTEKALRRHQFAYENAKSIFLKSFLIPVSVSLVTTLVTLWLKGLL